MNNEIIFRILNSKDSMYDLCENMEQVYDNFYEPLYIEYKELQKILMNNLNTIRELEKNQNSVLQQENKDLKEEIKKLQRIVISKQEDYLIISVGKITKVFKLNDNKKWINEVDDSNE